MASEILSFFCVSFSAIFHNDVEMWVNCSYLWGTVWQLRTLILLPIQNAPFLCFDFLALFRIGASSFFFAEFPDESQSKKRKIHSCSHPVSALQTFVSRCVPRDCPAHITVTRRIMFMLILLAQILSGQKFQVQKGCLALQIGFRCLSYLSDDTKAVQGGWFS